MALTFALAIVREAAPYCLTAAGVALILVAYKAAQPPLSFGEYSLLPRVIGPG
jgi:hypothetical protein